LLKALGQLRQEELGSLAVVLRAGVSLEVVLRAEALREVVWEVVEWEL
jgi:hypothetical protein